MCSTSFDRMAFIWNHRVDEFDDRRMNSYSNYAVLQGHKNAVLDCTWCDETTIATGSADKTIMVWDATTGQRQRKLTEHTSIVNAIDSSSSSSGTTTLISVSDDKACLVWDIRTKRPVQRLEQAYPALAVAVAGTDHQVFVSGIDPKIYCWDMRRSEHAVYSMKGHTDTVTSLALHPETTHVLSNSMDRTLRTWDIRPFVGGKSKKRHTHTFTGHAHASERGLLKCAWSADGNLVSAGSSDHRVHIWDVLSQEELYDLPGHTACVNAVTFHPVETTVVASGASDQCIYVGELSS